MYHAIILKDKCINQSKLIYGCFNGMMYTLCVKIRSTYSIKNCYTSNFTHFDFKQKSRMIYLGLKSKKTI